MSASDRRVFARRGGGGLKWRGIFVLVGALVGASAAGPPPAQEDDAGPVRGGGDDGSPSLLARAEEVLRGDSVSREQCDALWEACIRADGSPRPLISSLEQRLDGELLSAERRSQLLRIAGGLRRRRGDVEGALAHLEAIPEVQRTTADLTALAETLDALGRDEQARETYVRLLAGERDPETRRRLRLRVALLTKPTAGAPSPLEALAEAARAEPDGAELCNRVAIVLALSGDPGAALAAWHVSGEGTALARQHLRLAEWALESQEWDRAQQEVWDALAAAQLKRDRRTALTVLVDAYREDGALDELVARLEGLPHLDEELRHVWVDVLRETGAIEEALERFHGEAEGRRGATSTEVGVKREYLAICRATGRHELIAHAYRDLIAAGPRFIEWREGASRHELTRGDRAAAEALWADYFEVTGDPAYRLAAAAALGRLGLDELAERFLRETVRHAPARRDGALLSLFELHRERGRLERAAAVLEEIDAAADPDAPVRRDLADAFERIGDRARAARVLEEFIAARGADSDPDTEMELAVLLSEVDRDEDALEMWRRLWPRVESVSRRRFVEDRMMTVAARLGVLARIAVELERRLAEGRASDREAGLLVRIYTRVKDPVSAGEVIDEHMRQSGGRRLDALLEKSRVLLACEDYYNYEATVQELIALDPDGRGDYLRQLALSKLERGRRDEAREILAELRHTPGDDATLEFEAGVLAMVGMREEALAAYRRSLVVHPDRIDTYLLLGNVLRELGRHELGAGVYQYLATTAKRDDTFTIAVDGVLNMRDGRANRGAPDRLVRWVRRLTLERLARRPDRLHLHRLVADLCEELDDDEGVIRALRTALPIAGDRRTTLLRELVAAAHARGGGGRSQALFAVGGTGLMSEAEVGKVDPLELLFGRRLIGQGELVPPQVYLDLGSAFLRAGDVLSARRTFEQASRLPEFAELERKIADAFERARYPREALRVYQEILSIETTDLALVLKVAELQEQLGEDSEAHALYLRGLDLALQRMPRARTGDVREEEESDDPFAVFAGRNIDEVARHRDALRQGVLATLPGDDVGEALLARWHRRALDELRQIAPSGREVRPAVGTEPPATLAAAPRLEAEAEELRRLAAALSHMEHADDLDARLLATFPDDEELLPTLCRFRTDWGFTQSARRLVQTSGRPAADRERLLLSTGLPGETLPGAIPIATAAPLLLPALTDGRRQEARSILERLALGTGEKTDLERMPILLAAAVDLGEPDLTLTLSRHWLALLLEHAKGQLYGELLTLLARSRTTLDAARQRSLIEELVRAVTAAPDRFSTFIGQLPELEKQVGTHLLEPEQVRDLIRGRLSASDRFIYGIPELFGLLPQEERPGVLRDVWSDVPKSQRAAFLLDLLPVLDAPVEEGFAEFLTASFAGALADLDADQSVSHRAERLSEIETKENLPVARRYLELLSGRFGASASYRVATAVVLERSGEESEAESAALAAFSDILEQSSGKRDYAVERAFRTLVEEFHDTCGARMLELVDDAERRLGRSAPLVSRRVELLREDGDAGRAIEALRAGVEEFPDDEELSRTLVRELRRTGRRADALHEEGKTLASKPKDQRLRDRLVGGWRRLRNPLRALRLSRGEESGTEGGVERTPLATLANIAAAHRRGADEQARLLFRRLWRVFPDRSDPYSRYWVIAQASRSRSWPTQRNPRMRRSIGGLYAFLDAHRKKEEPAPRPSLTRAMADLPGGIEELRRRLRGTPPDQLGSEVARETFAALAELGARGAEPGEREETLERLLDEALAGRAGKRDLGLLLATLERAESPPPRLREVLPELLHVVDPRDVTQLRRIAKLAARIGEQGRAAAIYRWCATQLAGNYGEASAIIEEVRESLDGEERDRVITSILALGDPGEEGFWVRDSYDRLVLDTWEGLLGPAGALGRARDICDGLRRDDLGQVPRRRTAARAAVLYAVAGDIDRALECLEIAICEFEPPVGLAYPWYRDSFRRPGFLSGDDLADLFGISPEGEETIALGAEWPRAVAKAVQGWGAASRCEGEAPFRLRVLAALRLAEAGARGEAGALVEELRGEAEESADRMLWLADLQRELGAEAAADALERQLLGEHRLHVERIPGVIARVDAAEGACAALALGMPLVDETPHPGLLTILAHCQRELHREARARWLEELAERVDAAERELTSVD